MKYLSKTFTVPVNAGETEDQRRKREGYVWKKVGDGGYWLKSSGLHELGIPRECVVCGKNHSNGLSNFDAPTLDNWKLCRECYVSIVEGKEEKVAMAALNALADETETEEAVIKGAANILFTRGMRRWIKANWPEQYEMIYEGHDNNEE